MGGTAATSSHYMGMEWLFLRKKGRATQATEQKQYKLGVKVMINLSENEFLTLKQQKKVFPVQLTVNADQQTPIGIYYNLQGQHKFLLESVYSEREIGRYSFVGADPYKTIKSFGEKVEITGDGKTEHHVGRVLDYVQKQVSVPYADKGIPLPFVGGAVGYVGYDVIRQYEKLPHENVDELNVPEAYLMFYRLFVCYDHFQHKMTIVHNVFPEDAENYEAVVSRLKDMEKMLTRTTGVQAFKEADPDVKVKSNVTEEEFCKLVEQAKAYIKAGDIFQVVLSQRLTAQTQSEPFDIYRRLRSKNPSPYLFYIDFDGFQIIGSSPESLVTVQGRTVMTNPIAGTRPRGKNQEEDNKFKQELLTDEKEKAEHVMLVDLGRNDIGRISEFGTVKIDKFMEVEAYSHVMHIVSTVTGELKKGLTCFDALSACLPVGTVSGAPKIRAMEIIDELEKTKRGIYAGAVGYFSYNGNMDTCIAIRTIVLKDGQAHVQAGAGIVHDSVQNRNTPKH